MVAYNHEEDDPPHAQGQRNNNDNQALDRQNQDTRASYEHLHPSYNPNPYASLQRTQTPVLNSSQSQMPQNQVFNPVPFQMMPPMEANGSVSPSFGMMPQFQPGGFNPNTFGFPSNADANNNYLRTLYGPNTYQQTYENLAASKWVQQQENQRRAQAILEGQFQPSPVNFNPFQAGNPEFGRASQSQGSSAFTSPSNIIHPKSTPIKLTPLLSQRVKDNSRPSPDLTPHSAQHGYENAGLDKPSDSKHTAKHMRAAFEGPGGALSRNVNASFDTSVVDLNRPNDSFTWKVMEDIRMKNAARKRDKDMSKGLCNDDDDVPMVQATDEDKPTPTQHRSNEDTSATGSAFSVPSIVTTLPGNLPVQANTNDAADPVSVLDLTADTEADTDTDIDDATTVRDPSPDLPLIRRAGLPSPPGRYALPTTREIKRASRYVLWTQRESAAVAHVMDWASIVFGLGVPLDDARWELLSQRLATHYNVLRPAAVIRERWEKFLRGNAKFTPYPESLRNLRRRFEVLRQENEEMEDQLVSYNGLAAATTSAAGDKRKRDLSFSTSLSTSFDDSDTDNDSDSGPSTPSPFHVFPANPNAPAPSSPQTFPRPASKLRRVINADDDSISDFPRVAAAKQNKPKRKKAPSKHVVALARKQRSLPHAFDAAREAVAHLRTASAHSVRGSFDSPGTFTFGGGSYSSSSAAAGSFGSSSSDPKDVMRLRVVGQKVLDTFAAKTGVALPRDAGEVLRKAVVEFAGVMGKERQGGGVEEGKDDMAVAFEVEEMDVDDEADPGEMSQEAKALKERLEAQCVGRGVSFVCKEQDYDDDEEDEEEKGGDGDGEDGDKPGAEADGAAVEEVVDEAYGEPDQEVVDEAGGEPGEEGDGSPALV